MNPPRSCDESLALSCPALTSSLAVGFKDRRCSSQTCDQDSIVSVQNLQHFRTKSRIVSVELLQEPMISMKGCPLINVPVGHIP